MALDGLLLKQSLKPIQAKLPLKLHRIYHLSENEVLFQLKDAREKLQLLVSCHSVHNRLQLTQREFVTPQEPTNFVMLLRKHCEDSILLSMNQVGLDRVVEVKLSQRNALGDVENTKIMIELMGKYANLILVDDQGKIMDALKRIPPFENTKRTIQPGALYTYPETNDKKNPFQSDSIQTDVPLPQQFEGISPLLAREIEHRLQHGEQFKDIMHRIEESQTLYLHPTDKEVIAHCIPLTHLQTTYDAYPLMEGFDVLYHDLEEKERIKQHTGELIKFVGRELKKAHAKLPKLYEALDEALDCQKWQVFGDYLYAYGTQLPNGLKSTTVKDFETDEDIMIPLDEKYDGKTNAKRYYQKYQKGRKGQSHIRHQIDLTQMEADYFKSIQEQLSLASVNDAIEIRQELALGGYVPLKQTKRKKETKLHYVHLALPNGIKVYFGKNNLQNEAVTFKLAQKNDTWLHAKDYHGAHVILQTENSDEATLRIGAQIAAYFSSARQSSSVPVNYCKVREVKKIPQSKPGLVALGSYKTIYIDPDETFIKDLLSKTLVKD